MESRPEIMERLNVVFQEVFDDDSISIFDEMTAQDIEDWDSVSHISLMISVEKEFDIEFEADEIGKLQRVGDLLDLITQRINR
ncbi:MAG: acyl carrier protein [Desulfuromonadaceae bacterium]|nr:acyl carrier protein [Desulfuromonadaceae bacterium]